MPVEIFDAGSGRSLGRLTDAQFDVLVDALEEESPSDQDYYIDPAMIDMLEDDGADAAVVTALRSALGDREGMEIRWQRS